MCPSGLKTKRPGSIVSVRPAEMAGGIVSVRPEGRHRRRNSPEWSDQRAATHRTHSNQTQYTRVANHCFQLPSQNTNTSTYIYISIHPSIHPSIHQNTLGCARQCTANSTEAGSGDERLNKLRKTPFLPVQCSAAQYSAVRFSTAEVQRRSSPCRPDDSVGVDDIGCRGG